MAFMLLPRLPLFFPFWKKVTVLVAISLFFLCFASAIAVVYCKHLSRQLFITLQQLHQEVDSLQVEWSQLLLEQGTWAADARVERIASMRLKMTLPEPNQLLVISENQE